MALRTFWKLITLEGLRRPRPEVAVLRLSGVIGGFGPLRGGMSIASLEPLIERAFSIPRLKAVALVINSPGGSAAQSALIAQRIRNDPVFRGITGQFDRGRFDAVIRQAGFTESRYVAEQKKVLLRQQVIKSLTGDLTAPATAVDIQDRYSNEQRALDYFVLGAAQAGEIADPAPEVLTKFFDERKGLFRAPEFRKVELKVLKK